MKALLIDDERLARNALRRLLAAHANIEIVGEASNADEAKMLIEDLNPDVIFLDIQMPGKTGFELLGELDAVPSVICTTAYDQFALRAFEVSALDYLVKPIEPERLAEAVRKIPVAPPALPVVPSSAPVKYLDASDRVFVKDGDRCWFVPLGEIRLMESEGNYTRLYFGKENPFILRTLNHLEVRLNPDVFFRVNRGQIVNLNYVQKIDNWVNGAMLATLSDGKQVELSRRRAQEFKERMSL